MPGAKANIEPQKLGALIINGTPTAIAAVLSWQATFPAGPLGLPGSGIYNGLNPQAKTGNVGPGIDALNPPYPSNLQPDFATTESRYTWPEAMVAGLATGFHIQGSSRIMNCSEDGQRFEPNNEPETPYFFSGGTRGVTAVHVTITMYRLMSGFTNQMHAGDMQNRFSPFFMPETELIFANVGHIQVVSGVATAPATFGMHSFYGKIRSSRKLKVDDTIVVCVRVRAQYDSVWVKPVVATAIDATGYYST